MRKLFTIPLLILFLFHSSVLQGSGFIAGMTEKKSGDPLIEEDYSGKNIPDEDYFLNSVKESASKSVASPLSENISKVAEIAGLPGNPRDYLLKNGYLYIVGTMTGDNYGNGFLQVYDFSSPANPVLKVSQTYQGKKLETMMEENNQLLIVGENGLVVVGISNPLAPVEIAYHDYVMDGSNKRYFRNGYANIAKSGNLLFANGNLWRLGVFDISNLQAPVYKDGFEFSFDEVRDFDVISSTELLLNDGSGLRIVNFADPANLVVTRSDDPGFIDLPATVEQMVVTPDNKTAYTYSWGITTSLISVIDIASGEITGSYDVTPHTEQLYTLALDPTNTKLIATGVVGFHVFDVTLSSNIQYVSHVPPADHRVRINGNYLLSGYGSSKLLIYSLGQPAATSPSVISFSPASGAEGTEVTLAGTNFTGVSAVKFNGVNVASFTVLSATSIKAKVPAGATTGRISVVTSSGTAQSTTDFTVTNGSGAPTISFFSPTSGSAGTSVTINGTNFSGITAVAFNGTPATNFTANSATSLSVVVPAGATTGRIRVSNSAGTAESSADFTVTSSSSPTVTFFSPSGGREGTAVTINGTNFSGVTIVAFNGTSTTNFEVSSATSITAIVPTGATTGKISVTSASGTAYSSSDFTVSREGSGEETTLLAEISNLPGWPADYLIKNNYLYIVGYLQGTQAGDGYMQVYDFSTPASPVLKLTQTFPGKKLQVVMEEGNFLYTVGDNGLVVIDITTPLDPVEVAFHDYVVDGSNQRYFRSDYGNIAKSGNLLFANGNLWRLGVFDISDLQAPVYKDGFEFGFDEVRDYDVISSTELLLNDGSGLRTVNFADPANLIVGGSEDADYVDVSAQVEQMVVSSDKKTAYTYSWGSSTSLISVIDVPSREIIATYDVSSYGSQLYNLALDATNTRLVAAGINNFHVFDVSNPLDIQYAGSFNPGDSHVRVGGNHLLARYGSSKVIVYSLGQSAATSPSVTSFSPASGAEGTEVTLAGTNFTGVSAVKFNGVNAASFTVLSPTSIKATVPAGATTGRISVVTSSGTAQSTASFTVNSNSSNNPAISFFSPLSGRAGTAVIINGTSFSGVTSVSFNGTTTTNFEVNSATSITAIVPAGAASGKIKVSNATGSGQSTASFIVPAEAATSGTYLVHDIIPGEEDAFPTNLVKAGNMVFFSSYEKDSQGNVKSNGFYRTDGTSEGTVFLKSSLKRDMYDPYVEKNAVEFNGKLIFTVTNNYRHELWVSDGTSGGTKMFFNFPEETSYRFRSLTVFNGELYFSVRNTEKRGVYKWDGINTPVKLMGPTEFYEWAQIDFIDGGNQLFCSDGYVIYDITSDNAEVIYRQEDVSYQEIIGRTAFLNGKIIFTLTSPASAADRSMHGIRVVDPVTKTYFTISDELGQGFPWPSTFNPGMAYMGGSLYYTRTRNTTSDDFFELWKISPSFELSLVKQWSSASAVKSRYLTANSHLLILAFDLDYNGYPQLWKSDGTSTGTVALFGQDKQMYLRSAQTSICLTETKLYFGAKKRATDQADYGEELWISDFTPEGTEMALDLNEGSESGFISDYIVSLDESSVIFTGARRTADPASRYGVELWISDGSQLCNLEKPVISQSTSGSGEVVLNSGSATGNQWLKDGAPIAGATKQTYTVAESGRYSVKVSVGACSGTSDEVVINITGIAEFFEGGLEAYPNPTTGLLNLHMGTGAKNWTGILLTSQGRQLYSFESGQKENLQINLSAYSQGLYLLILSDGQTWYRTWVLKQ